MGVNSVVGAACMLGLGEVRSGRHDTSSRLQRDNQGVKMIRIPHGVKIYTGVPSQVAAGRSQG